MRKGIWEAFDGYDDIARQIEASREPAKLQSFKAHHPEPYINRLHPALLTLRVVDIIQETPSAKTLRLVSEDGFLPPFQAGQYISLFLEVDRVRTSRPYSISSQPRQIGYYDITVRRLAGGRVSNYLLDHIRVGDRLQSSGPQGHFYYNPLFHHATLICIAGGSGITPFMSMLREIAECGLDRTVFLFYGNKNMQDVIFHAELLRISERFPRIHYIPVIEKAHGGYTGECGLIDAELIRKFIPDSRQCTCYLCGPQGMYDFCTPALESLGIQKRHIRRELYGPPLNIRNDPGWPAHVTEDRIFSVKIKNKGTIQAPATVPLLVSLENNGITPPSICRSGECSMCRVKVLTGSVFQPSGTPVRKSDSVYGYVHACVSYPLEDLEILL